jgi:DNA-binding CsgD family transcriptional regulator/PAS domain-containing protein
MVQVLERWCGWGPGSMKPLGEADVIGLIDRIYDAAMSFDAWPDALAPLADAFGARDAALGAMAPHGIPWLFAPRTDPEYLRIYAEAYHPLNDVWHRITRRGVGRPATDAMVMPRDELVRSTYHNEWARPQGYSTVLGGMILEEHGWRTVLMLPGHAEFGRDELQLLHLLTPHIRRAVRLNNRLGLGDVSATATARLLQEMPAAAFLLDSDGRVSFANAAAEDLFRDGRKLRLVQGRLAANRPEDTSRLAKMIAACARRRPSGDDTLRLVPPSGPELVLQILPIRPETPLLAPGMPVAIGFDATRPTPVDAAQRLRLKYRLTAAEAAFALEIAKGDGKLAAAGRRGVSYATARTHLSRIFEKTGVHRQAELVRLVLDET